MTKFRKWYNLENRKETKLTLDATYEKEDNIFNDFMKLTLTWRFVVWKYVLILSVSVYLLSYICRVSSFDLSK